MKIQIQPGLTLEAPEAEQENAGIIAGACRAALEQIRADWELEAPRDCRLHLMTAPGRFFFHAAPWSWKPLLVLGFPIWYPRAQRAWPISAAWTQRFGARVVIGIKPPALWQRSDASIGRLIYAEETDLLRKLRHLTCHELVHACSAQLRLPAWLNEGVAALTVERFMQAPVFRADTLQRVRDTQPKEPPAGYREMARLDKEALAYTTVRGYWLVRYIEETQPGLLKRSFAAGRLSFSFEEELAAALGLEPTRFWAEIDGVVADHFANQR
jgi:hypothetical protein